MANYENIKDKGFDKRTTKEVREIAKRGGKSSGQVRRQKADFRRVLNSLLTAEVDSPEITPILNALGIDSTLESAVNMAMIKEAMAGNVKAYEAIAKYAGQSDKTPADEKEQKIRTERAKNAHDIELGTMDQAQDSIKSFLKAMNPTDDDLEDLFEEQNEETEKTEDV